jgi:hypothetical protein
VSETKLFRGPDFEGALFGPVSLASLTESTDAAANVANARLAPLVAALEAMNRKYEIGTRISYTAAEAVLAEFRKLKEPSDE